jgi:membrane associated rhomboid family serine protease
MIIPWGTDAPIYHWPKATVGLIVANVAAFAATVTLPPEEFVGWTLVRGERLHPIQWLTNNFLHADPVHLIGNMIFLWGFGIIVEGKLGWWRFLAAYLGLCVVDGAILQVGSLGAAPGIILGASGVIYALLAMCLVWAPRNELNCVVWFRFAPAQWEIPILWFAVLYIGLEAAGVVFSGGAMSSALLHLTGAILGFGLGTALLKSGLVDCENWDLFAVLAGHQGQPKTRTKRKVKRSASGAQAMEETGRTRPTAGPEDAATSPEAKAAAAVRRVHRLIEAGDVDGALSAYDQSARTLPSWPAEHDLLDLIKALHGHDSRARAASVPLMRDFCRFFPDKADRVRLKLAQILIRDRQRPTHALRVLAEIPDGALPPDLEPVRQQLIQQATRMQEEGILELEGDD